jgi:hypothetical protein
MSEQARHADTHGSRVVRLLVGVRGLSGEVYPPGTEVHVRAHGLRIEGSVDGFLRGDWIPLRWFEYSTGVTEPD